MPSEDLLYKIQLWNCSPKLRNSGMDNAMTLKPDVIQKLNEKNTIFKFVVNSEKEWKEIERDYLPIVDKEKIYLMGNKEIQLNKLIFKSN